MSKLKKYFLYLLGAFLSIFFARDAFAYPMQAIYGIDYYSPEPEPTLIEKVMSFVLSPIFIVVMIGLAFVVGIAIFRKQLRKNIIKKNAEKNP